MKKYRSFISESILDPIKKELNPNIFDENNLIKEDVRRYILENFRFWMDNVSPNTQVLDMVLLGSSAGYQYSDDSDIDMNCVLDGDSIDQYELNDILRILPNGNLLPGTKQPINYYLTTNYENIEKSNVAYDLFKNEWIKEPTRDSIKIPLPYIMEIAKFFMAGVDNRIEEFKNDVNEYKYYKNKLKYEQDETEVDDLNQLISQKKNEILADLDSINVAHNVIKSFRKEAYDPKYKARYLIKIESDNPNYSINNIIYKVLENYGYLDRIEKYEKIRDELV